MTNWRKVLIGAVAAATLASGGSIAALASDGSRPVKPAIRQSREAEPGDVRREDRRQDRREDRNNLREDRREDRRENEARHEAEPRGREAEGEV